ncbi:MAG: hypothetical protein WBA57_10525 [Elainellaceae cyanobacterium]
MSSSKQQVVVMIDNELMDVVDAWSGDRAQAIEEALYLWCQHQSELAPSPQAMQPSQAMQQPAQPPTQPPQPLTPAEYHRQRHDEDETGWLV